MTKRIRHIHPGGLDPTFTALNEYRRLGQELVEAERARDAHAPGTSEHTRLAAICVRIKQERDAAAKQGGL